MLKQQESNQRSGYDYGIQMLENTKKTKKDLGRAGTFRC